LTKYGHNTLIETELKKESGTRYVNKEGKKKASKEVRKRELKVASSL
jgi:hypothetical protein